MLLKNAMKRVAVVLSILFVMSCSSSDDSKTDDVIVDENPTLTVAKPVIGLGKVKFSADITKIGSGYIERGFCWGENINPTINNSRIQESTNVPGVFFIDKDYASPYFQTDTNYYVRAYVVASSGEIVYSENMTFVTPPKMVWEQKTARNIYTTSATINGTIAVNYIETTTPDEKGFCYKTSSGVTIANGVTKSITTNDYTPYSLEITNLLVNTTYYVKAYVREGARIYYSDEFTFKTAGAIGASGGYVFYDKGEFTDGWQYLEAAPANLIYNGSNKISWGCMGTRINQTQSTMGSGPANTARIISVCSTVNNAAKLCDTYTINGLSDWFLPSEEELMAFYKSSINVYTIATNPWNDVSDKYFWSSTESGNADEARIIDAYQGYMWQYDKNYGLVRVRPVRRY